MCVSPHQKNLKKSMASALSLVVHDPSGSLAAPDQCPMLATAQDGPTTCVGPPQDARDVDAHENLINSHARNKIFGEECDKSLPPAAYKDGAARSGAGWTRDPHPRATAGSWALNFLTSYLQSVAGVKNAGPWGRGSGS